MSLRALCLAASMVTAASPSSPPEHASSVPAAIPVATASPGIAESDPTDVLAFRPMDKLMTVAVTVSGRGPYSFIVDSGSERTVIARELANDLALARGASVRLHSMTEAGTVSTARIPHLQFSRRTVRNIDAPAFPSANIGAAGILGADSLQRQRVEFDFATGKMTIASSPSRQPQWGSDTIVVVGRRRYGRLVLTNVQLDGERILAVIDTGSDLTIGNSALRRRLAKKRRLGPLTPVELISVTGGRLTADYTQVGRVAIEGVTITNMPIGFADAHPFKKLGLEDRPAILLGMDTLRMFSKVSIDFGRRQLRLLPPDPATTPAR